MADYATTGDGLVAALQVLAVLAEERRPASEVCRLFKPFPQRLRSVRFGGVSPLADSAVTAAVAAAERRLAGTGRVLLRASGTEPVIRVMAEGEDEALVDAVVDSLCTTIADVTRAQAA
jgi:phosphoglucosamine mutase